MSVRQQIIISGVGGQGVLFATRILAETALMKGLPVFTSETHGMAQRGGTVLSHLKVGDFSSPLIRPFQADALIVMKAENLNQHCYYLKKQVGWAVVNAQQPVPDIAGVKIFAVDADALAQQIGNPKAVNLILLEFALTKTKEHGIDFYCTLEDVRALIEGRSGRTEV